MKNLQNPYDQPVGVRLNGKAFVLGPKESVQVDETQIARDRYITGLLKRRILRLTNANR